MGDTYNEKIWLQHPDEPNDQYRFFIRYYLSQKNDTRSLLMAYKLYLIKEKGKTEDEIKGLSTYGVRYTHWFYGKDSLGNKIEGLHNWDERAKAYYDFVFEDELNLLLERRGKVVEDEFQDGESLLNSWSEAYQSFLIQITEEKLEAAKAKRTFDGSSMASRLQKFVKMRDEIAVFLRRTVGLTDRITEDEVAKSLAKNKAVAVEWTVPKNENRDVNEIDEMSEEDFEELIKEKLEKLT